MERMTCWNRKLALSWPKFFYDVFVCELYKQIKARKFSLRGNFFFLRNKNSKTTRVEDGGSTSREREREKIDISFRSSGVRLKQQLIPV